jgi:hypothetical protein
MRELKLAYKSLYKIATNFSLVVIPEQVEFILARMHMAEWITLWLFAAIAIPIPIAWIYESTYEFALLFILIRMMLNQMGML